MDKRLRFLIFEMSVILVFYIKSVFFWDYDGCFNVMFIIELI